MQLVALCRAGFEKEVAAELNDIAPRRQVFGYARTTAGSGYVEYICHSAEDAERLIRETEELIFVRHWFMSAGVVAGLVAGDRVKPLLESLATLPTAGEFLVHTPDTNEGKSLGALAKSVAGHLRREYLRGRTSSASTDWRGDLLFIDGATAFAGCHWTRNASPWPSGIPRLRQPRGAPSRATLKLEEAWHQFVPAGEWDRRLAPGMSATDLGAAPGGWTWQLVNRSMFVNAVDNGGMDAALMESGQVRHHRIDAFQYTPARPCDWLVCDIADKPARVAALISRWAVNGWFGEAVFNLKLPMKQRYDAVCQCRSMIGDALAARGLGYSLRFKQLYHDREEVTGHLRITGVEAR